MRMEKINLSESEKINPLNEDYESEFEYDADIGNKRKLRHDLVEKPEAAKVPKPNKQIYHDIYVKEQNKIERSSFLALDVYSRHKKLINEYVLCYPGATSKLKRDTSKYKTDADVIRENHKFLWDDDDEPATWEQQFAKKYYDRLFKEYCLTDLSHFKERKIGMRWRTEKELIEGKGQFFCANIHCTEKQNLKSWEVNFGYIEHGQKKNALVKLRLCDECSIKLHYGYKGKAVLKEKLLSNSKKNQDKIKFSKTSEDDPENKNDTLEEDIWKKPIEIHNEPSIEEEFETFLEEMLL